MPFLSGIFSHFEIWGLHFDLPHFSFLGINTISTNKSWANSKVQGGGCQSVVYLSRTWLAKVSARNLPNKLANKSDLHLVSL